MCASAALEATQGQMHGFLVNTHTNATRIRKYLWEIDLRFAYGLSTHAIPPRKKQKANDPDASGAPLPTLETTHGHILSQPPQMPPDFGGIWMGM